MALEVDEHEEERRNECKKDTQLDERLRVAREEMGQNAATRRQRCEEDVVRVEAGCDNKRRTNKARKAMQPASSDEDKVDLIVEQMKEPSGIKLKYVEIGQQRLNFDSAREKLLRF